MALAALVRICLGEIKQAKANLIYLLGADDAGKSTLAKELAKQLVLEGKKVAIIDADPGQSSRLPLTLSLNYANKQFNDLGELVLADWDFMPSYNLLGCFQRYIRLIEPWTKKAKEEMDYCFVDSNGDVRKWLKLREIEILKPDLIVALQRKAELEPILKSLPSRIAKIAVPQEVKYKSSRLRKEVRNERLKLYFSNSGIQTIKCEVPCDFNQRIVGLYSRGKFLGLGIAEDRNVDGLSVVSPVFAKADRVEFSLVKLEEVLWQ